MEKTKSASENVMKRLVDYSDESEEDDIELQDVTTARDTNTASESSQIQGDIQLDSSQVIRKSDEVKQDIQLDSFQVMKSSEEQEDIQQNNANIPRESSEVQEDIQLGSANIPCESKVIQLGSTNISQEAKQELQQESANILYESSEAQEDIEQGTIDTGEPARTEATGQVHEVSASALITDNDTTPDAAPVEDITPASQVDAPIDILQAAAAEALISAADVDSDKDLEAELPNETIDTTTEASGETVCEMSCETIPQPGDEEINSRLYNPVILEPNDDGGLISESCNQLLMESCDQLISESFEQALSESHMYSNEGLALTNPDSTDESRVSSINGDDVNGVRIIPRGGYFIETL